MNDWLDDMIVGVWVAVMIPIAALSPVGGEWVEGVIEALGNLVVELAD